jgi:cell division protein FtsA
MNDLAHRLTSPMNAAADAVARPRMNRGGIFGALDVGTTKIACLIGRAESDQTLRVLGFGWQRGQGVRGGGITDIEAAERAIRAAVAQAEDMADHHLSHLTVNLSCGQPQSRLYHVQWPIGGRTVTAADVRQMVREGQNRARAEGREVIHSLPIDFMADETEGVRDPTGLHCDQLTARLHVLDAATGPLRNLETAIGHADLTISDHVSAPYAAGLATLVEDERELGAIVIDMGGGTTSLAVFAEGQLLHTAQLPVGGVLVTADLARGLSTSLANAERLKTLYGNLQASPDDDQEMLPVPLVGEEEHQYQRVPRSMLVGIIRPRLEETFELLRDRLEQAGLGAAAEARVVLTGGGSQLIGVRELAGKILNRQVRLGRPLGVRGLPESASGPAFATAAGLLAYAAGDGRSIASSENDPNNSPGLLDRILNFLRMNP